MIALILLDIHAKAVDQVLTKLVKSLEGLASPVRPLLLSETFGFYEVSLILQYDSHKQLSRFLQEFISPIDGLQRMEKYSLVEPLWLATKELVLANPPEHNIHAYMFIQPDDNQLQMVYDTLSSNCGDQINLRRFIAKVFYKEELQILLGVQSRDLEALDSFLRHCIRKQEGVINTNTLIGTLFKYLAPIDEITKFWRK